jgi:hypothetical protein
MAWAFEICYLDPEDVKKGSVDGSSDDDVADKFENSGRRFFYFFLFLAP